MQEQMLHLLRKDPSRNMARFYAVMLECDLFGDWVVVRYWGRIGTRGQSLRSVVANLADAEGMIAKIAKAKRARGYLEAAG